LDEAGSVYVADTGNDTIRKFAPLNLSPPRLRCSTLGQSLVLSWSGLWHGYQLESCGCLGTNTGWTVVSAPAIAINGIYWLTNTRASPAFFRLHKQ